MLVRYNPAAPGAKLATAQSISLELAFNASYWSDNRRTIAMARAAGGTWTATIPVEPHWHFLLFYLKDERGAVDSNGSRYWQVLACGADGTPTLQAVSYHAESYAGSLLAPGIQRPVDYAQAIAIVQEDMQRHPAHVPFMTDVWRYRAKQAGDTDAIYQTLGAEIERFVVDQKNNGLALGAATQFAFTWRKRLPAGTFEQARAALAAADPKSRVLSELSYQLASVEQDARKRATLLAQFIDEYLGHDRTQSAYAERFYTLSHDLKDTAATEEAFEVWRRFEPDVADVPASMGRYYVEQKIQPEKALALLTTAIDLCRSDTPPGPRSGVIRRLWVSCDPPSTTNPAPGVAKRDGEVAQLRYYRAQAQLQRDDVQAALADLELAARALPDDWQVAFTLAQACERVDRKEAAYAAYLRAATAPHQTSREPSDALERIFVRGGMGTREELDARIETESAARGKKVAAEYEPVPFDRPAPAFAFTTLDGRRLDNASLRGAPVVLNFWATWCGPCVAEMPGFVGLQRRNPNLTIVLVATRSELADVKAMVDKRKWSAMTVALSDATGVAFGVGAVPHTCVLDKDGRLRFVHSGGLSDVVAVIEKELALVK